MKKPKLTLENVLAGGLPGWCERYAEWLSALPSFQNMTERGRWGRIRALRALDRELARTLPAELKSQIFQLCSDIREMALIKAHSEPAIALRDLELPKSV